MRTIALNNDWDLSLNEFNNIAIKDGNEELAQDVASSVRVWKNELPFDRLRGVPYDKPDELNGVLGFEIKKQAKLVKGVLNATVVFNELEDRKANVTIYVENENGEIINVQ